MSVSSARIVLHFDVHQPIELTELTLSFGSLARQYRKFLQSRAREHGRKVSDADVKLFITKIENNCILAELAGATDILGTLFSVMEYANIFIEFTKHINEAILYFKGLVSSENLPALEIPYSQRDCEDYASFLGVVAQNKGGNLGLSVAEYIEEKKESKVLTRFTFTSDDAFRAQKGALLAQRTLDEVGDAQYKDVLMYFYQTNTDESKSDGRTGERAIINSIWPKDLPVYFISDLDRQRIMAFKDDKTKNPFKASYRVDVNTETDRNKTPRFYRVLRLHDIILYETD